VDDVLISAMLTASREEVEDITRRAIMTSTWDYFLDTFPCKDFITIPYGNLKSITSVKWKATDGTESTLVAGTDYLTETNGAAHGRIVLAWGKTWPTGSFYPSNPITIRFVCGWATREAVPGKIKHAIKMLCAKRYEDRGEAVVGQTVYENPAVQLLLMSDRLWGNFE
jgi:uncharacterized phiE125 gp8 family phage protein